MPWKMAPYQATEQIAWESQQGPSLFFSGPMYLQYGAATAYASSNAEASLLLGSPTVTDMRGGMFGGPLATRIMPAGAFVLGTHFKGDFYGTCGTSGTPNLQIRLGLVGPGTATTFNLLSDNAALAMTAAAVGSYFHVWFACVVTAAGPGAVGALRSVVGYEYGTTVAGSLVRNIVPAPQALATFDLNFDYTWDIRATFSAAHADNQITLQYGNISVTG